MSAENLIPEYFGIGIQNGKTPANLGTLWRSAQNLGASFIFTIGKKYSSEPTNTSKALKSIPYFHYVTFSDFYKNLPSGARLVGIEMTEESAELTTFKHPRQAVYLLGAEDHGLSKEARNRCHLLVQFNTPKSLNVAVAGSIVMYDRTIPKERL